MKLPALLLILLLPLHAQQAAINPAFVRKASQWMASTESSKRQAAYRSWMQAGPDGMEAYEKSLTAARESHEKAIDKLCAGSRSHPNPYLKHQVIAEELDAERERVIPLIRTDWKKDGRKAAMLRDEMKSLTKLYEKANRAVKADPSALNTAIDAHLLALSEIAREMERFDDTLETVEMNEEELSAFILKDHFEALEMVTLRTRFDQTRAAKLQLEKVTESNKKLGGWCDGTMKTFGEILNGERVVLGLQPLKIEEKLSAAAEEHSGDMARLGFFAHESPVPGKKTPWDRARKAGFQGNAGGENIYMGSTSAQSAYNAWFASDGHRFLMMSSGPNVLGVGISGTHWTMMTGSL